MGRQNGYSRVYEDVEADEESCQACCQECEEDCWCARCCSLLKVNLPFTTCTYINNIVIK